MLFSFLFFVFVAPVCSQLFSLQVNFIATVGHHYPEEVKPFPNELMNVLDTHATVLNPELRLALIKVKKRFVFFVI
jgi:hypothetical protein